MPTKKHFQSKFQIHVVAPSILTSCFLMLDLGVQYYLSSGPSSSGRKPPKALLYDSQPPAKKQTLFRKDKLEEQM